MVPEGNLDSAGAHRPIILGLLIVCYVLISIVSYTDYPRRSSHQPLTSAERLGQVVWRSRNCQVCHQIYGYGGFLGPDLTNRITEDTFDSELESILTNGQGRMPAFDLTSEEQQGLLAYLRRLNRSGRSQPAGLAAQRSVDAPRHWSLLLDAWGQEPGRELPADVRRGGEVWRASACGTCHVPFSVGRVLAPDLSVRARQHSAAALREILAESRGRMPSFPLSGGEIEDLAALLDWVSKHRAELVAINDQMLDRERFSWTEVPWFEYR